MIVQEIIEAVEAIIDSRDSAKYNISIGFFQGYNATVESDTKGQRFCDLKLHHKDDEGNDVSALAVPLMFMGNKNGMLDFELSSGDELLVLFTDRTLAQWKDASGTSPQKLSNPVKDSINHAMAIPICTVHNANLVSDTPVDSDAIGLRAKPGKKIEIGNGTDEVIDLFDQFLEEMKTLVGTTLLGATVPGSLDATGSGSTGTLSVVASTLATMASNITTIQTKLANLKV